MSLYFSSFSFVISSLLEQFEHLFFLDTNHGQSRYEKFTVNPLLHFLSFSFFFLSYFSFSIIFSFVHSFFLPLIHSFFLPVEKIFPHSSLEPSFFQTIENVFFTPFFSSLFSLFLPFPTERRDRGRNCFQKDEAVGSMDDCIKSNLNETTLIVPNVSNLTFMKKVYPIRNCIPSEIVSNLYQAYMIVSNLYQAYTIVSNVGSDRIGSWIGMITIDIDIGRLVNRLLLLLNPLLLIHLDLNWKGIRLWLEQFLIHWEPSGTKLGRLHRGGKKVGRRHLSCG